MNPTQSARQAISKTLEEILQAIVAQLELSEPSVWASLSPCDAVIMLRAAIATLRESGRLTYPIELKSLFAPTAEVQEIAMANDWHDKYLALSSQFDDAWLKYKLLDYDGGRRATTATHSPFTPQSPSSARASAAESRSRGAV